MSAMASHGKFWKPEGWLEAVFNEHVEPDSGVDSDPDYWDGKLYFLMRIKFGSVEIKPGDLPQAIVLASDVFAKVKDDEVRGCLMQIVDGMRLALAEGSVFDIG